MSVNLAILRPQGPLRKFFELIRVDHIELYHPSPRMTLAASMGSSYGVRTLKVNRQLVNAPHWDKWSKNVHFHAKVNDYHFWVGGTKTYPKRVEISKSVGINFDFRSIFDFSQYNQKTFSIISQLFDMIPHSNCFLGVLGTL